MNLVSAVANSGGWGHMGRGPPPGPNPFTFMQFAIKMLPNNSMVHFLSGVDAPLGNPGSVTGLCVGKFEVLESNWFNP